MNKRQITRILCVLGVCGLVLAGCGPSPAPGSASTGTPGTTSGTLRIWSQYDLTDAENPPSVLMRQRIADFESTTGIAVAYEQVAWDQLAPKLALATQSGGAVPDIVETGRQHIPSLFDAGALMALDDVLAEEPWVSALNPSHQAGCIIDGKHYCVANLVRGGVTYYRAAAFPDGFPDTNDAWLTEAARLKQEGQYISTFFAGRSYAAIEWAWAPWIYSNGGRIFDDEGKPAWASPQVVEVFAFARTLLAEGYLPEAIITGDFATAEAPWIEGDSASFRGGTWSFLFVPGLEEGIERGEIAITGGLRFNGGPPHVFLNNESWVIPTGAPNPEGAAAWISGFMEPAFLAEWSQAQFGIPTLPAAYDTEAFDSLFYREVAALLTEQGRYMDTSPYYVQSLDTLAIAAQEILLDHSVDIMERLKQAEEEILTRYW